jgi:hypothetical protein
VTAADLAALEAANTGLYAAVESGDFDAMTALWVGGAAGDSAVCVHPGWPAVLGRGPILRSWALIMANTTYIQFFLTDVESRVVDDIGVVSCQENILTGLGEQTGEGADGLSGGRVVATNVFRRAPSGWQLWMHHASPVLAALSGDDEAPPQDDADDADAADDADDELGRP